MNFISEVYLHKFIERKLDINIPQGDFRAKKITTDKRAITEKWASIHQGIAILNVIVPNKIYKAKNDRIERRNKSTITARDLNTSLSEIHRKAERKSAMILKN